mmetsp:Transcript_12831/g.31149  ORF Transcript_12831/g.31149 Transcript_12831/m.31149 type:complete len:201 (+) Transcript_12831:49-651(+)
MHLQQHHQSAPGSAAMTTAGDGGMHPQGQGVLPRIGLPGVTRPDVTEEEMAQVVVDACAAAANSRSAIGSAEVGTREYIRDLFLRLEQDPSSADALTFAENMASRLLNEGEALSLPSGTTNGIAGPPFPVPPQRGTGASMHGRPQTAVAGTSGNFPFERAGAHGSTPSRQPVRHPVGYMEGTLAAGRAYEDPICLDSDDD